MALTAGVQRPEMSDPNLAHAPQKGSTTIYQGGIVMLDTSGYARPAAASVAGAYCVGVATARDNTLDRYDNSSGSDGALTVQYAQGPFGCLNDGGNPILSTTQPGTILYAADDQTVSLSSSSGTRPVAGRLVRLDTSVIGGPVVVEMSRAIGKTTTELLVIDPSAAGFVVAGDFRAIKNVAGHSGAGACTATGAKVGDIVLAVSFAKVPTAAAATQGGSTAFESTISVANQIQQTGGADLSAERLDVFLLAQS